MSIDALAIRTQIIRLATESNMGNLIRAPRIPAKLPIEDRASERWCQAAAIIALELILIAASLVYQYIASFTTIDTRAAINAILPGMIIVL